MAKRLLLFSLYLLLPIFCFSKGHPERSAVSVDENPWQDKLRVRALLRLDRMLSWAIPYDTRIYSIDKNISGILFLNEASPLSLFSKNHGYFAKAHPLVGIVTEEKQDFLLTQTVLSDLVHSCKDSLFVEIGTAEILTKVLAYRHLEQGDSVFLPFVQEDHNIELMEYRIDKIFDLWQGMPAFGLVPQKMKTAPPILLYRGTDFSLLSKRSWASILSDLDIAGPGLTAFLKARTHIHQWLERVAESGNKARVMGFSLGGALAIYTLIYEHELIAQKGSVAFNPPGISHAILEEWEKIPQESKPHFTLFISKGDIIPKLGKLIPYAYELSNQREMRPIDAHVRLMVGERQLHIWKINLDQENKARFAL